MTTRPLFLRSDKISEQLRQLNVLKDAASQVEVTLSNGRVHHVLDTDIVSMQSIESSWSSSVPSGSTTWMDTSNTVYTYNQSEFTTFVNEIVEKRAANSISANEKYASIVPTLPLPDDDPVFSLDDWYT